MPYFWRRIAEIFIFEFLAAVLATLAMLNMHATNTTFILSMTLCLVINIAYMIFCLRGYLFTVSRSRYYKVNFTAYGVFAAINIIMACFNTEPVYTYLFFPYKLFRPLGMDKTLSALIVNSLFFITIFIVPKTMEWKLSFKTWRHRTGRKIRRKIFRRR